jgi:hypothetical protein
MVLFAAISLALIFKLSALSKLKGHKKTILVWIITLVLLVILGCEYATTTNRPSFDFNTRVNQAYYWLKDQKDIKTVVELPVVDPLDSKTAVYVTNQVVHGKALINSKENQKSNLTNVLGDISNPETIDWAYERGAQAIITHEEKCTQVNWGSILYADDKTISKAICIYKINKPITTDDDFIKYGEGFIQRPNAVNQQLALLRQNVGIFNVTNDSFNIAKGTADIQALIEVSPGFIGSKITLSQEGGITNSFTLSEKDTPINITVDSSKSIKITIETQDKKQVNPGDIVFKDVIAKGSV